MSAGDPPLWAEVDDFFVDHLLGEDPLLDAAQRHSAEAGLPDIAVSPAQGKLLNLLARMVGAGTILEIGALGGFSAIWLARALPAGGRLISLELDPHHAKIARENVARAGLADKVEVMVGPAIDSLPRLAAQGLTFDFAFIDADKRSTPAYFGHTLDLVRVGGVIVIDNVVRRGRVLDAAIDDVDVQGMQRFFAAARGEKRWSATALQTVGVKGWDGFAIGLVEQA